MKTLFKRKSSHERAVERVFKLLEKDLRQTAPGKWRIVNAQTQFEVPVETCIRAEAGQPLAYVEYPATQRMQLDLVKVA